MNETLNKVECKLQILNTRLEICEGFVKSCKNLITEEHRKKWWLEHPEVAYFTAHTEWETERWSRESYLVLFVQQVVDKNGLDIDYHAIDPLFFYDFPPLEAEVSNDEDLTTYRNPFIQ